jgi:hypothetical protein
MQQFSKLTACPCSLIKVAALMCSCTPVAVSGTDHTNCCSQEAELTRHTSGVQGPQFAGIQNLDVFLYSTCGKWNRSHKLLQSRSRTHTAHQWGTRPTVCRDSQSFLETSVGNPRRDRPIARPLAYTRQNKHGERKDKCRWPEWDSNSQPVSSSNRGHLTPWL